jgi:hypothetical protein
VAGIELSVSIGDAPPAGRSISLEASLVRRDNGNRPSGVVLRVAGVGGFARQSPVASVSRAVFPNQLCPEQPSTT